MGDVHDKRNVSLVWFGLNRLKESLRKSPGAFRGCLGRRRPSLFRSERRRRRSRAVQRLMREICYLIIITAKYLGTLRTHQSSPIYTQAPDCLLQALRCLFFPFLHSSWYYIHRRGRSQTPPLPQPAFFLHQFPRQHSCYSYNEFKFNSFDSAAPTGPGHIQCRNSVQHGFRFVEPVVRTDDGGSKQVKKFEAFLIRVMILFVRSL